MKIPKILMVSCAIVLSVVIACSPRPAPVPGAEKPSPTPGVVAPQLTTEQQIIEAAKKEGAVELWTQTWPPDIRGPFEKAFLAKYPFLKLTVFDTGTAAGGVTRLAEEAKIGRRSTDAVLFAETDIISAQDAGVIQEYDWPKGWPGQPSHKLWLNVASGAYFPVYNTEKIPPSEVPKTYEDLKNPKWRGRAAISTSGRGIPLYTAWIFGGGKVDFEKSESFWRQVVASVRPRVMSGYEQPNQMLAAGEYDLLLMSASDIPTNYMWKGAPVRPVALETAPVFGYSLALVKYPAHPNAARLLLDFFTSAEGNLIYADGKALAANNPESTKTAKTNAYYQQFGLKMVPVPADIYTTENTARASRFWSVDLHK